MMEYSRLCWISKKVPFVIFLFGRIYGWNALEMVFQPFQSNDLTMKKKNLMVKVR